MTRIFDDPAQFTDNMLDGFVRLHAGYVTRVPGGVVRVTGRPGKVAVIVGGGSGHYPAFCGIVGPGFADAAVVGNVFTSPSAADAASVGRSADCGAGVLLMTGNYAGDVMNFTLAADTLKAEGIDARYLVVTDDISARQVQLVKTQFYESKSYPTFTPVGPWLTLVDAADLARLDSLRLTLSVSGEVRQDSTVADMIVRPAQALTLLSRFQPMAPGDLLLTGTPGGTALKAPAKLAGMVAGLLPPATRWKLFFKRQAANPRYLHDGDLILATIASPDGQLDLGTQWTPVIRKTP